MTAAKFTFLAGQDQRLPYDPRAPIRPQVEQSFARSPGACFLTRVEDLDRARCRPQYVDDLMRDMEWLGLTWDETPLFQSARDEVYREALSRLEQEERVYPCFCTRAEIARAASAPHGLSEEGPPHGRFRSA